MNLPSKPSTVSRRGAQPPGLGSGERQPGAAREAGGSGHTGGEREHAAPSALDESIAKRLKRDPAGLVAAVAQQYDTGEVLMLAWMDDEALHRTLTTGRCTYWSRSRQEYWVKGETSGHVQRVISVALDCDGDAVLVKVDQAGGACHTGDRTCFDAGQLSPRVLSLPGAAGHEDPGVSPGGAERPPAAAEVAGP